MALATIPIMLLRRASLIAEMRFHDTNENFQSYCRGRPLRAHRSRFLPPSKTLQARGKRLSLVLTVMIPSTVDGIPGVWQKQAAPIIEVLLIHTIAD